MDKANVLKYLNDRIKKHKQVIENLPSIDVAGATAKGREQALIAMGKLMAVKEQEHLHKGALLELDSIKRYVEESK